MRRTDLQAQRRAVGLSQEALAQRVGVSVTSVRAWERGTQTPYLRHHEALAHNLKVTMSQLNRLLNPAPKGSGNGGALDGLGLSGGGLPGVDYWLNIFVRAEQAAAEARVFGAMAIPALLQTRGYATSVERTTHRAVTDAEVAQLVDLRLARKELLTRDPNPLVLTALMPQHVLDGGPAIMASQCEHLLKLIELPNIEVRIVTSGEERLLSAPGSFTLLTSAGASRPDLAAEDGISGFRYHETQQVVADITALFDHLLEVALSPSHSADLIRKTREDYR